MGTRITPRLLNTIVAAALALVIVGATAVSAQAYTRNFYYQGYLTAGYKISASANYIYGSRILAGGGSILHTAVAQVYAGPTLYAQAEATGAAAQVTHARKIATAKSYFYGPSTGAEAYVQSSYLT
ncbi:hypothetical protein [Microbacterium flavescens]|uniref:hypothetical protein n=1 Tax=Microbacterium flavescens TaxID=69366 RepID=UPI001BDF0C3D|nr:hypothetical protein [Microbacterium flavescens]BFF09692.1 hypothetical protein GCM10025699_09950 [Microbacterium flavescens]